MDIELIKLRKDISNLKGNGCFQTIWDLTVVFIILFLMNGLEHKFPGFMRETWDFFVSTLR